MILPTYSSESGVQHGHVEASTLQKSGPLSTREILASAPGNKQHPNYKVSAKGRVCCDTGYHTRRIMPVHRTDVVLPDAIQFAFAGTG